MPNSQAAFDSILAQFKTVMDISRPNVPIAWPNVEFTPKDDYDEATHEAWARITAQNAGSVQKTIGAVGSRRWRVSGIVFVQIFAPLGNGANEGLAIADDVVTALRGITTSGVRLKASTVEAVGRDTAFYQVNVNTPFEYDELA